MDAKKALAEIAIRIDKQVLDLLNEEQKTSGSISPIVDDIFKYVPIVTMGGKRLRGAFVYYSYLMHGGKDFEEILKVSALIEVLHSYLLTHDDIMDKSAIRHRKPTIHKIYQNNIKSQNKFYRDSRHFGESVGINIGDILSHISMYRLTETNFDDHLKIKTLSKLNRAFADTGYGQLIDVFGEIIPEADENHVMLVHYYKTGKYTYENPLHIGATLAGAKEEDLKVLTDYAIPGGIAFQIQDDILGMFGDEYRIGKPANSDLKEGKKTLLIIKALENADEKQKEIIEKNLGNTFLKKQDLEDVRKVIIDTGSLEYSKKTALDLVTKAKNALAKNANPSWIGEGRDFLDAVADYMIKRDL
jgi:geranylgeranyl diphosphate synthase, type I